MSNIKKHSLLILAAMLILLVIPMSFAADVSEDTNATVQASASADEMGISEIDDIQSADELEVDKLQASDDSDVLSATALTLAVDETTIEMEEGGSATISGKFTYNVGYSTYKNN